MSTNVLIKEFDNIIESICDDLLITDNHGIVLKVSKAFDRTYELMPNDIVGKSVFELETEGYFNPSITKTVIETGEKTTLKQRNKNGRDIIVTAIPIKNSEGEIRLIVSFSRDITDLIILQNQYKSLEDKMRRYREELKLLRTENVEIQGLVAESLDMIKIIRMIDKIASFDANVLLTGQSGVGKSMIAKLIHNKSNRKDEPYIEINCGAIPDNLLESELFGYEKGAFTGANKIGKIGLIELAQNGTLFLDEVSELPLNLQVKVLKVIQDKKVMRVGGTDEHYVNFRLITASNRDLEKQVQEGLFREDLYYRLKVIPIDIPPLKERKDDIVPMILFFLDKFNEQYNLNKTFSYEVIEALQLYEWPGNIRELENLVERLVLTSETSTIDVTCLPIEIQTFKQNHITRSSGTRTLPGALEELERKMICDAYSECGTTTGVAKRLGISQPTAVRKIKKYISEGK